MLLLVYAVALLAGSALMFPAGTHDNLNHIIDLINDQNKTLTEERYMQKVAHAGCKEEFFCQVLHILRNDSEFRANQMGEKIVRNLELYLTTTKFNCPVVPANGTEEIPVRDFLTSLKKCIQITNFGRGTVTMKTVG